jgi:hypothetical protein
MAGDECRKVTVHAHASWRVLAANYPIAIAAIVLFVTLSWVGTGSLVPAVILGLLASPGVVGLFYVWTVTRVASGVTIDPAAAAVVFQGWGGPWIVPRRSLQACVTATPLPWSDLVWLTFRRDAWPVPDRIRWIQLPVDRASADAVADAGFEVRFSRPLGSA